MRIKNLPAHGKQSYSVNYLYEKEKVSSLNEDGKITPLYNNFDNNTKDEWIDITKENCKKRFDQYKSKNLEIDWNKNTMQLVISLNPMDNIKMENAWEDVLAEVMIKLDIDPIRNNAVAWLHTDKEHHHAHLLFSKIDINGNKWNDSHIGHRVNSLAKEFVEEYDLTYTEKNNGTRKQIVEPAKQDLNKRLYKALENSSSYKHFLTNLANSDIKPTYIADTNTLVYSCTFDNKEYSFNEGSLQAKFRYDNLVRLSEKKEFTHSYNKQKGFMMRAVSNALNSGVTSFDELSSFLSKKYDITIIYNESKLGKVSGLSFISNQESKPIKVKGSQINFSKSRIDYFMRKNVVNYSRNAAIEIKNQKGEPKEKQHTSPIPYFGSMSMAKTTITREDVESDEERRKQKRLGKEKGRDI